MKLNLLISLALVLSGTAANSYADETSAALAKTKMTMSLGVNERTNNRALTLETTNTSEGLARSMETNLTKFVLSATNIASTNTAAVIPPMLNFARTNVFPTMSEVAKASDFWLALKERGDLPGMAKDDHGKLTTGSLPSSALQYPFAVTFHVVMTGDSFTNHYTIGQATENAPWQLEKAWRTDAQGQIVKEWPVK